MTHEEIYNLGLKCLKQKQIRELENKKARLKNEILTLLNEPMNKRAFSGCTAELIDVLNELERLANE